MDSTNIPVINEGSSERISIQSNVNEHIGNIGPESVNVVSPTSYYDIDDKPRINGVELIGNKTLEQLGVRDLVIQILIEYGLISGGELTPEQIQALNEMTCVINNDGDLVITYDNAVLDIGFSKPGDDLTMDNNINAVFYINNNNLEVTYGNN